MQLFKNALGLFSRRPGPDFIIVGAQKAGTTALHLMLQDHPNLVSATPKEVHYFDNDAWFNQGNIKAYHAHFPKPKPPGTLTFEASPMYLYHPEVPARLKAYNPRLRLIVLLREPASRAFSAWTMYHHHFKTGRHVHLFDPDSFDVAIENALKNLNKRNVAQDPRAYVERGFYAQQLKRYFQYFQRDQVLVLENKDISEKWDDTSVQIFDFLQIPHHAINVQKVLQSNINESDIYKESIEALRAFYLPYNDDLYKLLGRDYEWNKTQDEL
jgi:hypothetical protein